MRRLVGPAVVLAIVGVLFGLQIVRFSGHVAMPPASAEAPDVVDAYVTALDAHDCATAVSLWAEPDNPAHDWCDDVSAIRQADPAHEAKPMSLTKGEQQVVTGLDVRWRPFHDDHTLPKSPFGWVFVLRHTAVGWRIVDQGQG